MFLLPINQVVLKRLMGEGNTNAPCNIYEPFKPDEKKGMIQDFLKFTETCVNRIRRPNNSFPKMPRVCSYMNCLFSMKLIFLYLYFLFTFGSGSKWRQRWKY